MSCSVNERFLEKEIDISGDWLFQADTNNVGLSEKWYAENFDDKNWDTLDAGIRWEEQGFEELDNYGWYRKRVALPKAWQGGEIWIKFGGVNDEYELFVNGKSVSHFGEANISVASRPTFSDLTNLLK
jgi:sialate O-acetylesterase